MAVGVGGNTNGMATLSGAISGTGGLTMTGPYYPPAGPFGDVLNLSGSNSYTGATAVTAGVLQLGSAGALGNGTNNTSSVTALGSGGGALDLNGFTPTANVPLSLTGQPASTVGALTNSSATAASFGGPVTAGHQQHRRGGQHHFD